MLDKNLSSVSNLLWQRFASNSAYFIGNIFAAGEKYYKSENITDVKLDSPNMKFSSWSYDLGCLVSSIEAYINSFSKSILTFVNSLQAVDSINLKIMGTTVDTGPSSTSRKFIGKLIIPSTLKSKTKTETPTLKMTSLSVDTILLNPKRKASEVFPSPWDDYKTTKTDFFFRQFSLDETFFDMDQIENILLHTYFFDIKWVKPSLIASFRMGDVIKKTSYYDNFGLVHLLDPICNDFLKFTHLILTIVNGLIISWVWILDKNESYNHHKAKILATTSKQSGKDSEFEGPSKVFFDLFPCTTESQHLHRCNNEIKRLNNHIFVFFYVISSIKNWFFSSPKAKKASEFIFCGFNVSQDSKKNYPLSSMPSYSIASSDLGGDLNNYSSRLKMAAVSGKLRRWAEAFMLLTSFSLNHIEIFPTIIHDLNIKSTQKIEELPHPSLVHEFQYVSHSYFLVYYGIFGCLKWMSSVASKSQMHETESAGWEWTNLQRLPNICGRDVTNEILAMILELSSVPPFQLDPRVSESLNSSHFNPQNPIHISKQLFPNRKFARICLYSIILKPLSLNVTEKSRKFKNKNPTNTDKKIDSNDIDMCSLSQESGGFDDPKHLKINCVDHLVPSERHILDIWAFESSCLLASLLGAIVEFKFNK
ncbi:hypothetical protein AYI68_g4257 [Smittium mucronatum]|uniref:Uncharacterized protein n=1 Tax=Smittium mucronatum TaxID=133383 RepID=A0A1R0GXK7_9FUNG|nr:hypothetical protein AYI68_g4257 [Smittium mucronatum]